MSEVEWDIGRFLQNACPIDEGSPPITAREIAERLDYNPATVASALQRMKRKGLVDRNREIGWYWT